MYHRVQSVAVVGAGVSGVLSAIHLTAAGLDVTVFERSATAGGVWVYDERQPLEPTYPSTKPSIADFTPEENSDELHVKQKGSTIAPTGRSIIELQHAPPSPCYAGLKNNVPTPLLAVKGQPWRKGTPDFVNHHVLKEYIQEIALKSAAESEYLFNTRVERVWKEASQWSIQCTTLKHRASGELKKIGFVRKFDAVVIASGHYHAANVPDIPGLKKWKAAWPSRIEHSKGYRQPHGFQNQNLLLVGAGTSSTDIAREISPFAKEVYQVSRGGLFDLPESFLPGKVKRVGAIEYFSDVPLQEESGDRPAEGLQEEQAIPGTVKLKDGTLLSNIHRVLLCTGYHCSYPFLPSLHDDAAPVSAASPHVLVTDGTQTHNLHKDIFYIPDPTLAFVGVPYYSATFSLFEFQAIAVAAAYARRATLPTEEAMRREYERRVRRKGYGRSFHSLKEEEVEYVRDLVGWVNQGAAARGLPLVEGHTEEWLAARKARIQQIMALKAAGRPDSGNW
ncbi:hypothetical protein MMC34_000512 [Xylographa carneopallida]|nr:hypothetical protein [Xylographa carneopallida]